MPSLPQLADALNRLVAVAAIAVHHESNDDTTTAHAEAQRAITALGDLGAAMDSGDRDQSLYVLHGLNNKLTGVLSLTMLAREELAPGHAAEPHLRDVEEQTRRAARLARDLADSIAAGD